MQVTGRLIRTQWLRQIVRNGGNDARMFLDKNTTIQSGRPWLKICLSNFTSRFEHSKHPRTLLQRAKDISLTLAACGYVYSLIKSNTQDNLLRSAFVNDPVFKMIDSQKLRKFDGRSGGRSQGGYVTDGTRVFHEKKVFSERALILEMLVGNLFYSAYPEVFPEVIIAQDVREDGHATYKLLSEVKAFAIEDFQKEIISKNLEEFMEVSSVPDSLVENVGVAIAAHCLVGDSDTKLANIVLSGSCYPIDFEGAGQRSLVCFRIAGDSAKNAKRMVEHIAEYQQNSNLLAKVMNEDAELDSFDPYHPLKGDLEVLSKFRAWLEQSIQQDVDSGRLQGFYQKVADLTDEQLQAVVDGIPFVQDSKSRTEAINFLNLIRNQAKSDVTS